MTISANYINEYTFITHGTNNFTEEFHSGRRVRSYCGVDGYKYGTVSGSFYLESTTVVLYPDIGNELTSNLESVEYGIVGTLNGSMPNHSHLNDESQGGLLFEASIVDLDKYTTGEIDNMLATLSGSIHDPVSLSIELSNSLLDISTQQLILNTQEANTVFAGPSTGTENIPSFRKLVASDIPALSYLTTETDPVFSAWDKSTGISITESQISDFGTYLTNLTGLDTDDLAEGLTNKYFPGFTSLATDYSFTDNSSDWDTAYGWGNHASAGYLNSASTGVTADSWTINSDKANVTSSLIFGRTTGGDGIISYNDSGFNLSRPVGIGGIYPNYDLEIYSATIGRIGLGRNQSNARNFVIEKDTNNPYGSSIYFTYTPTGGHGYLRFMASQDTEVARFVGSNQSTLLAGNLTLNSTKADVTSTLTFGRTTGGDATISWDGISLTTNKSLTINSSTTVAMKRFIRFITSNGLAGCVYATRTSAANTDAYFGFLDAKESWAYYFRTDSSHVWKVNNIDKMYLNDTTLTTTGNLYVGGNVSADSFTDRTPFYEGDAVTEIMNIKGKDGEIDHSSLPSFARKEITKRRFEDVELTTEVDAKNAYTYDTRTVEVKGVEQEEIIEDSKRLKDTVYEDEKTGKFYEKDSVGEVKIKDGKPYQNIDVGEEIEQGRDLGAMISMLTVAVQQLTNRLNDIEKWAEKFGGASKQE